MSNNLLAPAEIHAHLDEYIIGQEDAKKVLSVAVYNHYKRIQYNSIDGGIQLKKSNIMMVGPTGSGKTYLASTLAKILNVPFAVADATVLNTSGHAGINNMLAGLVQAAGNDLVKAGQGIIYIDEIDKLSTRYSRTGESVQQAMLRILEGTNISGLDTTNILFIVGGAFVGLDTVVGARSGNYLVGVPGGPTLTELIKSVQPVDLAKYGLIPEFVGRIPVIVGLTELSKKALIDILTKPKNSIVGQYKKMLALDGVELVFNENALNLIANRALEKKTGARGLRSIIEECMLDVIYRVPSEKGLRKVIITEATIAKTGKPIFIYETALADEELTESPSNQKL